MFYSPEPHDFIFSEEKILNKQFILAAQILQIKPSATFLLAKRANNWWSGNTGAKLVPEDSMGATGIHFSSTFFMQKFCTFCNCAYSHHSPISYSPCRQISTFAADIRRNI